MQDDDSSYESKNVPAAPKPAGLQGAFRIRTIPLPWPKAIAAALTMGICVLIGTALGHVSWGLLASVGGFTSLYVHNEPYRVRAVKLLVVNLSLAISFALGTASASSTWAMAVALSAVSAGSTFVCGAYRVPPPSGYFFILACALGTGLPYDPGAAPMRAGFALIGGCVAWVISMTGWLFNPHKPETHAVAGAYRAIAAFLSADEPREFAEHNATLALRAAEEAVAVAVAGTRRTAQWHRLFRLYDQANALFLAGIELTTEECGPISPALVGVVRAVADAVPNPDRVTSIVIPTPDQCSPAHMRTYTALNSAVSLVAHPQSSEEAKAQENMALPLRRNAYSVLRNALDRHSLILPAVFRIMLTVMAGTLFARACGNPRPYWVPLTCASVLQGATTVAFLHRTIQRAIGTALGVLIAGTVLALHLPVFALVGALMVFQMVVELVIVRNYGLAVIFITPLPLILAEAGFPEMRPQMLVTARLFDTLLGCLIGVLGGLLLWRKASSVRLPTFLSDAIRLEGRLLGMCVASPDRLGHNAMDGGSEGTNHTSVFSETPPTDSDLPHTRRTLQATLINLRTAYDSALSESTRRRASLEALWPAVILTQRIGYLTISASVHHHSERGRIETDGRQPDGGTDAPNPLRVPETTTLHTDSTLSGAGGEVEQLHRFFQSLASAAEKGRIPKIVELPHSFPEFPAYSRIRPELYALQEAMKIGESLI